VLSALAAEAAGRLLTPTGFDRRGAEVDPKGYFSAAEIKRGRAFARPQLLLATARGGIEAAVLLALVRRVRRQPPRLPEPDGSPATEPAGGGAGAENVRAVASGAVAGAGIALATTLAPLPLAALARRRAIAVGLVTQTWRGWAEDLIKATVIECGFAAAGGGAIVALTRRYPEGWWAPAAGAAVVFGAGLAALAPVVLAPVFNEFVPLPDGETRRDVIALAKAGGVAVGEVFSIDASRRTTAANAYVTGLGPTKRVVLFDTLLDRYSRDEIRVVVAHELAHVRHRDVLRGVAFSALVAGPAAFAVQRLSWALSPGRAGTAAALPGLVLATGIVSAPLGLASGRVSRAIERRADDFSLGLSGAAEAFISFEQKICRQNVADVRPPGFYRRLAATHPPTVERIAAAAAHLRG
jgi:STE24 endopeptidase